MSVEQAQGPNPMAGPARLIIGFAQGMVLLALDGAWETHQWPATEPWLFTTLVCVAFFVPITVLAGIGALRFTTLLLWTIGAAAAVVAVTVHASWRQVVPSPGVPSFVLMASLGATLFIAYHLVAAADAERRVIASYRSYFDIAWKNGVQLALSLVFLGIFWLLLHLGAALFELIKIDIVRTIIRSDWFVYPACATVFAAAVHISDVQVGLINGARNLALMLLSWLLPVMAVLAIAFLLALTVVGLEALWATVSATTLLLIAAAALAILINATYRDGAQDVHWTLRVSARLAALALVPLVGIAAYSLWLRIDQHGLTPERVVGVACIAVAACYTLGYAIAALWPGRWMRPLEVTNVAAAFVALGLLIALLTPIADPARIAVDDQVARLKRGVVGPDTFDFAFLRDNAAKYGREALDLLRNDKSSPRAQAIAQKAQDAFNRTEFAIRQPTPAEMFARLEVYPKGAVLPDSFVQQDWKGEPTFGTPMNCVATEGAAPPCEAFIAEVTGDGRPDVLIRMWARVFVFAQREDSKWAVIGYLDSAFCGNLISALKAGNVRAIPPVQSDLDVEGRRYRLMQNPCS